MAYPRFNAAKGVEVVLGPGDLLYVPPYWMHRVTSQTFSASVSVLSPSKEVRPHSVPGSGLQGDDRLLGPQRAARLGRV